MLTLCLLKTPINNCISAIATYKPANGRLGDNIINYCKAKWISYTYNIPLFYCPFKHSDTLMIHEVENKYHRSLDKQFKKTIHLNRNIKTISIDPKESYLYKSEYKSNIDIDWEDQQFIKELKKTIAPRTEIKKTKLPKDRVSVALHVRKGGGIDFPLLSNQNIEEKPNKYQLWNNSFKYRHTYADCGHPLKFPPDQYFIEQIRNLYSQLNNTPLHIHLFTDDKNPIRILKKYQSYVKDLNITFSCRTEGNSPNKHILDDLFSMLHYDCLIRSASHFSFLADIVGNFFISIYPEHAFWIKSESYYKLIIDKIKIKIKKENFYKILNKINPKQGSL